jgi:hypothetical protein
MKITEENTTIKVELLSIQSANYKGEYVLSIFFTDGFHQ